MSTNSALEVIAKLRSDLAEIWSRANNDRNSTAAFERLERWHERAVRQLHDGVSQSESSRFRDASSPSVQIGNPLGNVLRYVKGYDATLSALAEEIERDPTFLDITPQDEATVSTPPEVSLIDPRKVFVVHGHDEANTLKLSALLRERFNLEAVVMSAAAGQGRTLIEKFEQLARDCAFAFVILTPDDSIVTPAGDYAQARPNVTFELGWFFGRLGRDKVVMLFKEGTQVHSDLDGVSRIQFIRSVEEKVIEIERELAAANIPTRAT
jgi:predicted nucleotide-binding protein